PCATQSLSDAQRETQTFSTQVDSSPQSLAVTHSTHQLVARSQTVSEGQSREFVQGVAARQVFSTQRRFSPQWPSTRHSSHTPRSTSQATQRVPSQSASFEHVTSVSQDRSTQRCPSSQWASR